MLKSKFFWSGLVFLILLAGLFYFFLLSAFFKIKQIEITGNSKIALNEIEAIVSEKVNKREFLFISKNIFLIDFQEIEKNIESFPAAAGVILKKDFPDKIIVNIEERVPIGNWCQPYIIETEEKSFTEYDCYHIDKQGVIFEKSDNQSGLVIKSEKEIIFSQQIVEKDYLENILEIYNNLKQDLKIGIKEFNIIDQEEKLVLFTDENWEIFFNPTGDISNQLFNLNLLFKEKIPPEERENLEYIDLRFGNRVFYRNK